MSANTVTMLTFNNPPTAYPTNRPTNIFLPLQSPGSERVQFYMASLLATLVLDKDAMAALQARGEGPPMFRTTLRQLARTLARLKAAKAAAAAAGGAPPPASDTAEGGSRRGSAQGGGGEGDGRREGWRETPSGTGEADYRGEVGRLVAH